MQGGAKSNQMHRFYKTTTNLNTMKIKLVHSLIIIVSSSILYGGYKLLSEPLAQNRQLVIKKTIANPEKKTIAPKTKQFTNHLTINTTRLQTPPSEATVYNSLNQSLTALMPNQSVNIQDLNLIASCNSCLQLIQGVLLKDRLSNQQFSQLTRALSKGNHRELAQMLVETAEKMQHNISDKDHQRFSILADSLTRFHSANIAEYFSNYLVNEKNIPIELVEAFATSIDHSVERSEIANNLLSKFMDTTDVEARDKLLALGQPEFLSKINTLALEENDYELYQKTLDQLSSTPSEYALDTLLAMPQMQSGDTEEITQLTEIGKQLAYRQLSGSRLDHIEEKLINNSYSEQEKTFVLDILQHSEDAVRGSQIIAKFSSMSDLSNP